MDTSMTEHEEILIVDNIPIIQRSLLMDILVPEGFHVRFANNGELALRSVASTPPHLILLNINMPGWTDSKFAGDSKRRKKAVKFQCYSLVAFQASKRR